MADIQWESHSPDDVPPLPLNFDHVNCRCSEVVTDIDWHDCIEETLDEVFGDTDPLIPEYLEIPF